MKSPYLTIQYLLVFTLFFAFVGLPANAIAQNKKAKDKKDDKKKELPEPEKKTLTTRDGVQLNTTWYASTKGKKAPCIILLHDYLRSSRDFTGKEGLAVMLQSKGFAVIAPDLRGHGGSKKQTGRDKDIDPKRFRRSDLAKILEDIETCKRFLVSQNNDGKLNIELLTILAVGKFSTLAVDWSVRDWSFGLNSKGIKQGKDVKAILLLSPEKSFKGMSLMKAVKAPVISGKGGEALPLFILTGDKSSSLKSQSRELEKALTKSRGSDLAEKSLSVTLGKTDIQGAGFASSKKGQEMINQFISLKVLSEADNLRWQNRTRK